MNKVITDGLVLMPPPFSAGLNLWSREDGGPGSASYAGQPNAAYVPADQDFGGCMEIQKTATTQKLRSYAQTPIQPGLYLRVSARVKAVSGALPSVRIAGWAGGVNGSNVPGVPQTGPVVALPGYGRIVTVSAIIATGNRQGVDMPWGTAPVYGHFGLDLIGANFGTVRIDDIVIEDVTEVFIRKLMDWVDVRDYGARGDGVTDDAPAFALADAAAMGRQVLVSSGTYLLNANVTFANRVRFEGKVALPLQFRLSCIRDFDLDTYASAFGSEEEGFRRGIQALFYFSDHAVFDLSGRRVALSAPVDVAALSGVSDLAQRRVLANGLIEAADSPAWADQSMSSVATYAPASNNLQLTGVTNVASVPIGARLQGTGVGREIYVTSKNVAAKTVQISRPLWGASGTRTYGFVRYRYMLDFSGFTKLSRFEITDMELSCNGRASGVMLPPAGSIFRFADCTFNRPKDRAITSIGTGCQGLVVDQCQFLSNEQPLNVQDRTTICLNVNANDAKIRECRIVRFAHFAIMSGSGNLFIGNHFFQGDDVPAGVRRAGIVFTSTNVKTLLTGNYIDNCHIEWGNEHDSAPEFASEFSFGAMTVTGNIFTTTDASPAARFFVMKPYGPGHFINGLSISDNVFRTVGGNLDRIDDVDTTFAALDTSRFRNVVVESNAYNGINQATQNPVIIYHVQNTAADVWVVDTLGYLPFGARARNATGLVPEGPLRSDAGAIQFAAPYAEPGQGPQKTLVNVRWPSALKGTVNITVRGDNPN